MPFNSLNNYFNVDDNILEPSRAEVTDIEVLSDEDDTVNDYRETRKVLHNLIKNGEEAIQEALMIAKASEKHTAFEAVSNMIKNVADVTDKLIDLQKKMRELEQETSKSNNTVNQAFFVGSTAELQKLLKDSLKNE